MAQIDFDASDVPTTDPFELLPDNTEMVGVLDKSEMKTTAANDGHYLACEFVVTEGPHEGRRFFENMNLDNKNPKAVDIAKRKLSALCHACGKVKVSDSDELIGIPVRMVLGVEPARGEYEARNKIKQFKPLTRAALPDAASKPAGEKKGPWAK